MKVPVAALSKKFVLSRLETRTEIFLSEKQRGKFIICKNFQREDENTNVPLTGRDRMDRTEEEMSVSISAVGAVAYVCCTVTFVLLVCLLFFLGLTPTQRSD